MSRALDSPAVTAAAQPDRSRDASLAGIRALVDVLASVPDRRKAGGIRHHLGAVLAVMVFAVLSGARNFREIADRAADLPPVAGCSAAFK